MGYFFVMYGVRPLARVFVFSTYEYAVHRCTHLSNTV